MRQDDMNSACNTQGRDSQKIFVGKPDGNIILERILHK